MNAIMDLHTHTIASGHGYSTLQENIAEAKRIGLKYLGLSEHGPAMPGGPHIYFFSNYKCVPRQHGDLRLLCGPSGWMRPVQADLVHNIARYPQDFRSFAYP